MITSLLVGGEASSDWGLSPAVFSGENMATYIYKCDSCKSTREVKHKMGEEPDVLCSECGNRSRRAIQSNPFVFRGKGFYGGKT